MRTPPAAPTLEPDTKDWTWVLERPCPDCGYDAGSVDRGRLGRLVRDNATGWAAVLADPQATERPDPRTWSVTEYACHVRDVHRLFAERLASMLAEDGAAFDDWDQDATALADRYDLQHPATVGAELLEAAQTVAAAYDAVPDGAWDRRGVRSNGSAFTVETFGRYHLHDLVHHLWDVREAVSRATLRAYDAAAEEYARAGAAPSDRVRAALDRFMARLPAGARVLEIGSAGGHDARALEEAGASVRRTDVVPAFVALLRSAGHDADRLDPLLDELADPARPGTPYDGVWANASLLHVHRTDLPRVLARLAEHTVAGGALHLSVKEGDGDTWSVHGSVPAPRSFTLWREAPLRAVLEAAGWTVEVVDREDGKRGERWLVVLGRRR